MQEIDYKKFIQLNRNSTVKRRSPVYVIYQEARSHIHKHGAKLIDANAEPMDVDCIAHGP